VFFLEWRSFQDKNCVMVEHKLKTYFFLSFTEIDLTWA